MLERITDRAITRDSKDSMGYEPTYSGVTSFLRRRYTKDLTGVDVAVSGVALDTATTNRPGARFGPRAIRAASTNMAWFGGPGHWHMDPFETLSVDRLWRLLLRSRQATGDRRRDRGPCDGDPRRRRHAADARRRSLHRLSPAARLPEEIRAAIAGPFRRPFRHLARGREAPRPRHHVLPCRAGEAGRSRAFGADRPAHPQ